MPPPHHPRRQFSHFGFFVRDLERMTEFYSSYFGLIVTDRGNLGEQRLPELRRMHAALADWPVSEVIPVNHGTAWPVYFRDPEGNPEFRRRLLP